MEKLQGPIPDSFYSTTQEPSSLEQLQLSVKSTYHFKSIPGTGVGLLTVGKLYGGILIYENWRSTKFGHLEELRQQVHSLTCSRHF